MAVTESHGSIWTFYSYKGGVGRSLALANIATQLSRWGYRVLCVDWDLDAPGLHLYFDKYAATRTGTPGIVELVAGHAASDGFDWRDCRTEVSIPKARGHLDLIRAGTMDDSYIDRMQELDWRRMYSDAGLGTFIEELRTDWAKKYDFVLVDSRTGVTDIGGVCTVQLPDFLAVMFTANEQSISGALDIARRANRAIGKLPFDRSRLPAIPIVSRFEAATEFEFTREWLERIGDDITDIVSTWLDRTMTVQELLNHIKVPYVPRWSFGEQLPVLDERTGDPLSISYAFETIAALVAHDLEQSALLATSRSSYVDAAARAAPADSASAPDDFEFDVFVSYDRMHRHFAEELMQALSERGLRVRSETEDIEAAGDASTIAGGLAGSRNMVAVVAGEPTKWMETEYRQFLLNSLSSGPERLFVPVLLTRDAAGSPALAQFRSVDASSRSPAEVADQLAPVLSGRGWPVELVSPPVEAPVPDAVSEPLPIALERLALQRDWHRRRAMRARQLRFRALIVSGGMLSLAFVVLAASLAGFLYTNSAYAIAAIAGAVGVLAVVFVRFDASPREAVHIETANALERERVLFEAGAAHYADAPNPSVELIERVEAILSRAEHQLVQHAFLSFRPAREPPAGS
jgi:MinD-like ATPase involved in chromosome partitioning or flagellar assembly